MITSCLRRFGLWPVIVGVTVISIAVSLAMTAVVHLVVLGIAMPPAAWILSIGCPLVLAPTMSLGSFSLLIQLDVAHEQLRRISHTDHLTGALNRRCFMERLLAEVERSVRSGAPFTVALIDVDNFKAINDTHGHLAGDEVLRTLAHACMQHMREGDTFARFGGEEFAVLLPGTDAAQALHWLERLREQVAQLRVELAGAPVGVPGGIGGGRPSPSSPGGVGHIHMPPR